MEQTDAPKRILVTGSEGYIGTCLVPVLVSRGHSVTRLDSGLFLRCRVDDAVPGDDLVNRDIRDLKPTDLAGFDVVIHLAGLSNDPLSDLDPELTLEINHSGTARLALAAKRAGVRRFVFSSTCSVYGFHGEAMIDETATRHPLTAYAESKCRAEDSLISLNGDGFEVVILRNGTVFGMSPMIRFDLVVNNLIAWARSSGRVLLKSDGKAWRPLVHVEDVCKAFRASVEACGHAVGGQIYNIGLTSNNIRIRDLADMIASALPGCEVALIAGAGTDTRSYRVNCNKAETMLPAYDPEWSIKAGIDELIEALGLHATLSQDFEGSRYSRIAHLKQRLVAGDLTSDLRPVAAESMTI